MKRVVTLKSFGQFINNSGDLLMFIFGQIIWLTAKQIPPIVHLADGFSENWQVWLESIQNRKSDSKREAHGNNLGHLNTV